MTDFRQVMDDRFKDQPERGNPHGGHGRRAENDLVEQFETQTGHPLGETSPAGPGDGSSCGVPRNADRTHDQHARKGQAESPRDLNLNQPEKKREGHH